MSPSPRLVVLGLSHRTAPVGQREKAALHRDAAQSLVRSLVAHPEVAECATLSTCNRTEVYTVCEDAEAGAAATARELVASTRISAAELRCAHYARYDDNAARHLFRVAAGLDSMVLGESEVQGQVRSAAERAEGEGTVGALLRGLFRHALAGGRRVRRETGIGRGATSLSSVAVDIALRARPDLSRCRVLVIGAGRMAAATGSALQRHGASAVAVANRSPSAARALAAQLDGRAAGIDMLEEELAQADIVVSSTEAPHVIVHREQVARALASRPERPLALIDLAVPRDIDAHVSTLRGALLYDIDDLERAIEQGLGGRRRDVSRAERIVEGELARFRAWQSALAVTPTVASLHAHAEQIRRAELLRAPRGLDAAQLRSLDALTRSLVTKLLHEPTLRLRETGSLQHAESIRHLFALDDDGGDVVELRIAG
ncbi:MAG: glutamyl-tRNA reductase [Solirubrobacteraceae bacterium]